MDHDAASAPRFRFHQNVVIFLVAIPPTNVEAADPTDRFRFRFHIPANDMRVAKAKELMEER